MNIEHYNIKAFMNNRRKTAMNYLTLTQKIDVMTDCNEVALVLLEFYISKTGYKNYSYSDDIVAKALCWKQSKVQKNRLLLVKHKYFSQIITRNSAVTHTETIIGQRWEDDRIIVNLQH